MVEYVHVDFDGFNFDWNLFGIDCFVGLALTQPNSRRNSGQIVFGKQSILHFLLKLVQKKEQGKK